MNKDELIAKRKDLKNQINALNVELRDTENQIALINCPFNIGERVINKKGEEAVVSRISLWYDNDSYKMKVKKIKKNGDLYKDETDVWSNNHWQSLEQNR